jgi:hypothetical protein
MSVSVRVLVGQLCPTVIEEVVGATVKTAVGRVGRAERKGRRSVRGGKRGGGGWARSRE